MMADIRGRLRTVIGQTPLPPEIQPIALKMFDDIPNKPPSPILAPPLSW
jgi:hypothetical protein